MFSLRSFRLVMLLLLGVFVAACSSPAGPRYPEEKPQDEQDPNTGDTQSLVISHLDSFWV